MRTFILDLKNLYILLFIILYKNYYNKLLYINIFLIIFFNYL